MTLTNILINEKLLQKNYDLLKIDLKDLLVKASEIRDRNYLNNITYSPKVFIPLTMLCRDRCGYCTFSKPPARLQAPFLSEDEVLKIARQGESAGCFEALFTLGEKPELRYPQASQWLKEHGYESTVEYLYHCSDLVMTETSLLSHLNPGALDFDELKMLKNVSISQGMMLESIQPDLNCHFDSPDKEPRRRLETLDNAGQLNIPFTTGILVGIGETMESVVESLSAIAELHNRYGHIQEVIVQNFIPKSDTKMHTHPPCDRLLHQKAIALARIILPEDVSVQAPPNLAENIDYLLRAGINDLGGISPITIDHVNPEKAWPLIDELRNRLNRHGFELLPRLGAYPRYIKDRDQFIDPGLHTKVIRLTDSDLYGRDTTWWPGTDAKVPDIFTTYLNENNRNTKTEVSEILEGIDAGQELSVIQIEKLFRARGNDVASIFQYADRLRTKLVGNEVTFVKNRNINYTNVCTFKCRFCAFSKGPLSLNLRGDPYLLDLEDLTQRAKEAYELGATEVCLQGGIHPNFDGEYYLEVLNAIHGEIPELHIHAFSALEVFEGAKRSAVDLKTYLIKLKDAGLRSLPGTAAEILDDDIRKILCPDKINTEEWLNVHQVAHEVGLTSNVTIMFGAIETAKSWAKHLYITKQLGNKTKGFLEFVPLPFVHMATPIYLKGIAKKGPTHRETMLMYAVGRIVYGNDIPNIQASWVKLGFDGVSQALQLGCNDLGGTLIDENISRAAGAAHGQKTDEQEFKLITDALNRPLVQRNTKYQKLATV